MVPLIFTLIPAGISVKIRGTNSLRGNNEPLYVVDGVIISSSGEDVLPAGVGNSGQESQNGLNGINPRDIESIQVLKDASADASFRTCILSISLGLIPFKPF